MSSTSGSTWLFVDEAPKRKLRRQRSDNNIPDPRSLGCVSVSPKELQQQQELFDFYNKQKLEQIEERRVDSSQQPTPSGFRRHLKSLPSAVPSRGKHWKEVTTSSTGATVGEYVPPEGRSQTLALPPPSSFRHKHTISQPPPPNMPWGLAPLRSATEPMYLPPTTNTGLLNVNGGEGTSPPMPVPQLPHHHSAPPAVQGPFSLPLQSLPPGYDFALAAQFRPEANKLRPLRLLSLDGGGVRGISSLQVLKKIMDRIKPGARPCDYFDLIAGTSTGGLIAIMLGRLRMTVDECIQHYHHLAKKIFKRNPALQYGSLAVLEHRFSPENLEEAIKSVVAKKAPRNSKMADDHPRCARTFVIAVRKHNVNNQPARRIRSYATQTSPADTCEIWQAGRATSAAPSYFPPIEIPDERGRLRSYIDGGLGYNNPCKELFNEAREVFGPHHEIGCFLSIGTGRDRNIQFGDVRKPNSAYQAFKHIALNSHHAHLEMQEFNAGDKLIEESENQEDFVQAVALEDWHKMASIEASTKKYLEEEITAKHVARCAKTLARIAQTDKQQRPS